MEVQDILFIIWWSRIVPFSAGAELSWFWWSKAVFVSRVEQDCGRSDPESS
jgi:hypothetical protein